MNCAEKFNLRSATLLSFDVYSLHSKYRLLSDAKFENWMTLALIFLWNWTTTYFVISRSLQKKTRETGMVKLQWFSYKVLVTAETRQKVRDYIKEITKRPVIRCTCSSNHVIDVKRASWTAVSSMCAHTFLTFTFLTTKQHTYFGMV